MRPRLFKCTVQKERTEVFFKSYKHRFAPGLVPGEYNPNPTSSGYTKSDNQEWWQVVFSPCNFTVYCFFAGLKRWTWFLAWRSSCLFYFYFYINIPLLWNYHGIAATAASHLTSYPFFLSVFFFFLQKAAAVHNILAIMAIQEHLQRTCGFLSVAWCCATTVEYYQYRSLTWCPTTLSFNCPFTPMPLYALSHTHPYTSISVTDPSHLLPSPLP